MYRKINGPAALRSLMKLMLLSSLSPEICGGEVIEQESIGCFLCVIDWKWI